MTPDWTGHLGRFHDERPGITETVLGRAEMGSVGNPYSWLVEPLRTETGPILDLACGSAPTGPLLAGSWWFGRRLSGGAGARRSRGAGATGACACRSVAGGRRFGRCGVRGDVAPGADAAGGGVGGGDASTASGRAGRGARSGRSRTTSGGAGVVAGTAGARRAFAAVAEPARDSRTGRGVARVRVRGRFRRAPVLPARDRRSDRGRTADRQPVPARCRTWPGTVRHTRAGPMGLGRGGRSRCRCVGSSPICPTVSTVPATLEENGSVSADHPGRKR